MLSKSCIMVGGGKEYVTADIASSTPLRGIGDGYRKKTLIASENTSENSKIHFC